MRTKAQMAEMTSTIVAQLAKKQAVPGKMEALEDSLRGQKQLRRQRNVSTAPTTRLPMSDFIATICYAEFGLSTAGRSAQPENEVGRQKKNILMVNQHRSQTIIKIYHFNQMLILQEIRLER